MDDSVDNTGAAEDLSSSTTTSPASEARNGAHTQSPQQLHQQQHNQTNHATHHQQQQQQQQQHHAQTGSSYTNQGPSQAGGNSAFSPQTPSSVVSSLTNPHNAYPPSSHTHDNNDNSAASFGTPPVLGPNGLPLDKKARACESCRGLKVRCEPDPTNPNPDDGPCRRCAKAGRACVVTQPTRKRQKKTDSRVLELERKIDALTASLQATRGGNSPAVGQDVARDNHTQAAAATAAAEVHALSSMPPARGFWTTPQPPSPTPARALVAAHVPAMGQGPAKFGGMEIDFTNVAKPTGPPPMVMAGQKRKFTDASSVSEDRSNATPAPAAAATPAAGGSMGNEYSDMIDRGILTMERANELWARYNDRMVPHLPGVVFEGGTTGAEIRKTKPVLFLAIMAVSSSEMPSVQRTLTKELMQILADKVIVVGEKSLELVQALQVAVMWYWPPEHFEELKFYQLVHIAAVMAIDIGLGRKKSIMGGGLGLRKHIPAEWRQQHFKKHPLPDSTSLEARRAWLACYFLATNTSMALHRPNLIRWNSFMTECVDILESSPEAAPTDKYFCHLVWTHKLAEEVGIQFAMDDPSASINIADSRTQYALRGFERDLEKYSSAVPEEYKQPSLKLSFHVLNLYMHEIATQPENSDDWKQANTADMIRDALASDVPLTPAHINALSACLTAIDGIFEVFLSMEVSSIRCLPVFNFVRVAYAVVVLIKMYFAASSPKSELGKVINKDNMKVEQHLDNLLEKFGMTAADDKSRPASKFLVVLVMLRSWFQKQKGGGSMLSGEKPPQVACPEYRTPASPPKQSAPPQDQTQQQQQDYSTTANTPLQLLSEIATKENANNNTAPTPIPRRTPDFYWAGRHPQQPFMYDDDSNPNPSSTTPTTANSNLPNPSSSTPSNNNFSFATPPNPSAVGIPWLDGFDYTSMGLGDGFAQAMDLTLAGLADGSMMGVLPPGNWDGTGAGGGVFNLGFDTMGGGNAGGGYQF